MSDSNSSTVKNRIEAAGPKRILALDGGGARGLISLGILETVEKTLRERPGLGISRTFKLCDYFDLICGTSTGAISLTRYEEAVRTANHSRAATRKSDERS